MTEPETQTPGQERTVDEQIRVHRVRAILPFFAVFLPIVFLSVYSLKVASDSVRSVVESQNTTAASNLSQQITEDIKQNVALAHAVASLDGTVKAIETGDQLTMRTRLKAITISEPVIHRAFLVNTGGTLISEFPTASGSYGSDLSGEEWFQHVKTTGNPAISGIYFRPQFPDVPVVAIAVPSRDGKRELGVLVFEYSVDVIRKRLETNEIGVHGYMFVVDQHAALVAHPQVAPAADSLNAYVQIPMINDALRGGEMKTTEYVDPVSDERMLATFVPLAVGPNTWVVVAEQSRAEAYRVLDQVKMNLGIAGFILTIFTLGMVFTLARISAKNVRLNADLQLKNQSLKDFTSIVSHQLKAPITAMRWNIESILDGDYGEIRQDLRDVLEQLHEVNISNYRLIMDILNVSRLDRGVVAVELKDVPLQEIVQRAIRDYLPAAQRAGLYLKVEDPGTPVLVKADLEKAAECITNSISNALKHTKQGGITVRIKSGDGKGIVEVADTGEGMPPEILKNLFSRDGIRKANAGAESSSGLGLYIARQFMQMQGGDIEATAVTGQGSTFTYWLKLA